MSTENNKPSRRSFIGVSGAAAGAALIMVNMPLVAGNVAFASGNGKKHRWGFLIDLERCIGCKACSVACKTEFGVPLGEFRSSVKEYEEGRYPGMRRDFVPWLCNHCENPICLENCPVDEVEGKFTWPDQSVETFMKRATYQRPDGVVLVDYERCIGCGACVEDCPYKVRFLNPARRNADGNAVADKCTLCVHRLDAELVPACVNTCQANARVIGDMNDPNSEISKRTAGKKVQVLLPGKGTKPSCKYIALNSVAYSEGRDTR